MGWNYFSKKSKAWIFDENEKGTSCEKCWQLLVWKEMMEIQIRIPNTGILTKDLPNVDQTDVCLWNNFSYFLGTIGAVFGYLT
jgi:hypothetical protein